MPASNWPAISNDLLKALIDVLDLKGQRVSAITLRLEWNHFAKLTIERCPLEAQSLALCEAIRRIDKIGAFPKDDMIDRRVAVEEITVPLVDDDGKAVATSSRFYPGPEEVVVEEAAKLVKSWHEEKGLF